MAVEGGFSCALDLVKFITEKYKNEFFLTVAGYPEGHPNAITKVEDEQKLSESEKSRMITTDDGTQLLPPLEAFPPSTSLIEFAFQESMFVEIPILRKKWFI